MSKIIKKILNFQKRKNGNISILVLIMSMAIILLTTAMVGYIFHDIRFTELDKGELRALHFAESGLSNMYYKIESGEELQPEGSYKVDVPDPADPEGRFEVEYKLVESVEGVLDKYTITSTGTDISSGVTRKVKVEVTYIDISQSLRTGKASGAKEVWGGQTSIIGPFFAEAIDDDIVGTTTFKKGPLYVKGDINLRGSASIGEPDGEGYGKIVLIQGGVLYYNNDPVEDPLLNPPANSKIYVSEYYKATIDLTFYPIDDIVIEAVKASGAREIPGDLFIGQNSRRENVIMVLSGGRWQEESYPGYLEFNDYGILEIGDIVVNGVIYIGEPPRSYRNASKGKYTIEYSGNGNLISYTEDLLNPGNIFVGNQLIPKDNLAYFPENDLMALISQNNIELELTNADGYKYDINNPDNPPKIAVMLFANEEVTTSTNTYFRGGTVSRILNLGTSTELYYETGIGEYLTGAVPGLGESTYQKLDIEWQEIIAD